MIDPNTPGYVGPNEQIKEGRGINELNSLKTELQIAELELDKEKTTFENYQKWVWIITGLQQKINSSSEVQVEEALKVIDNLKIECFEYQKKVLFLNHRNVKLENLIKKELNKYKNYKNEKKTMSKKELGICVNQLDETAKSLTNEVNKLNR